MNAKKPDSDAANGGNEPALSPWRILLIFLAAAVPITLLARGLYPTFDLPKDSGLVRPALSTVLLAAIFARPNTFRHMTIVATVGVTVGAVVMLCYLPVALFSQTLEIRSLGFMIRLLATLLLLGPGTWIAWLACRRLGIPVWERPAKDGF